MITSMSYKSLTIMVAALGFTGVAPRDGGARIAQRPMFQASAGQDAGGPTIPMPAGARSLTLTRAPDGLFYVTAQVNDTPVRFVVDTGANVVVLTKADANAAGIAPGRDAHRTLRTAGGRRAMRWTSIRRLRIGGRVVDNTDAIIVAADGPPHSLLGQSALARFESVTLRGNEIELKI